MAYNNYAIGSYPNPNWMYQPSTTNAVPQYPPVQQPSQQGIVWVQGEAGAKSYMVGAGQSVLLMDSDESCFYIKTADASGMPLPLRVFDYKERNTQQANKENTSEHSFNNNNYVTREEFDDLKKLIDDLTK